jgi:hypothetical protein
MDTAFADQMKKSPGEAVEEVSNMMKIVRETGGVFSGVWHNYALSETHGYKGWRYFFEEILKLASS